MENLNLKNVFIVMIIFIGFIVCVYWVIDSISYRYTVIDGNYYKALHIRLPGYTTHCKPANEIDLSKWVGSKMEGLEAFVNDEKNPEIEASIVLKAIGVADSSYVLEQRGEHFVLFSPEKTWEVWSWSAYYRIGGWIFDGKVVKN